MARIHLCFGCDSPLGYVKNKSFVIFFSTTALWSTLIQLNRTTIWTDFSQYISKYMALNICSLKYLEQCITPGTPVHTYTRYKAPRVQWSMYNSFRCVLPGSHLRLSAPEHISGTNLAQRLQVQETKRTIRRDSNPRYRGWESNALTTRPTALPRTQWNTWHRYSRDKIKTKQKLHFIHSILFLCYSKLRLPLTNSMPLRQLQILHLILHFMGHGSLMARLTSPGDVQRTVKLSLKMPIMYSRCERAHDDPGFIRLPNESCNLCGVYGARNISYSSQYSCK